MIWTGHFLRRNSESIAYKRNDEHTTAMNEMKNAVTITITLLLSISIQLVSINAYVAADGDLILSRSKLKAIFDHDHDRQLGGSKSSKTFAGNGSKSGNKGDRKAGNNNGIIKTSHQAKKSDNSSGWIAGIGSDKGVSKASTKSGKSSGGQSQTNTTSHPKTLFAKSNKGGKNSFAKRIKSGSPPKPASIEVAKLNPPVSSATIQVPTNPPSQAAKTNPPAPATDNSNNFTSKVTPILPPPATVTPRQSQSPSSPNKNTNTNSLDEKVLTQKLENSNGSYAGLSLQNLAVGMGMVAIFVVLASVVGVAVKKRRRQSSVIAVLDSIEMSPASPLSLAEAAQQVQRVTPTNAKNAPVVLSNRNGNSCGVDNLFGLKSCWV